MIEEGWGFTQREEERLSPGLVWSSIDLQKLSSTDQGVASVHLMSQGPILPFVPAVKAASGQRWKKGFPYLLFREPDVPRLPCVRRGGHVASSYCPHPSWPRLGRRPQIRCACLIPLPAPQLLLQMRPVRGRGRGPGAPGRAELCWMREPCAWQSGCWGADAEG